MKISKEIYKYVADLIMRVFFILNDVLKFLPAILQIKFAAFRLFISLTALINRKMYLNST
jgi:hypothetical protein